MSVPSQDFADRDLRDRSFKGQDLRYANFRGADLRGCNFAAALLTGADFSGARLGVTWRRGLPLLAVAAIAAVPMIHVLSRLLFAVQGQTREDAAWWLAASLYGVLAGAGTIAGLRVWAQARSRSTKIAGLLLGSFSGALLGFFYVGAKTFSLQFALVGAGLGAIGLAISSLWQSIAVVEIVLTTLGAVISYGVVWWIGSLAIAFLSTGHWLGGLLLALLTLVYLGVVVQSIAAILQEIRQAAGTCFRGADLTDAKFDGPSLTVR